MAKAAEILAAVEALGKAKKLSNVEIVSLLKEAIMAALARKFGPGIEADITIDRESGTVEVIALKRVVDEVEDPSAEVLLEDARLDDPDFEVGDIVEIPVNFDDFGRHAVMAAKQRVLQGVRESERERIRETYEPLIGELITGEVTAVGRGKIDIMLNRDREADAILPRREQNFRERFRNGEPIRAVLVGLSDTTRGPRLILSRAAPEFVAALFKLEVPEIQQGMIEVMGVAREVGGRTKIAVASLDEALDPVGTCVGMRGARVQAVVSELGGERIDIVPWHPDPEILVKRALAPASVKRVQRDGENERMTVVVDEDQLSLAIGKKGQNVRLASQLTGWEIDLYDTRQWVEREQGPALAEPETVYDEDGIEFADFPVDQIGLSEKTVSALDAAGYGMFSSLLDVELDDLLAVEGIDPDEATAVMQVIDRLTV